MLNPDLELSSFDLIIYSYLREELINTAGSEQVTYLKTKCPCLLNFVNLMDFIFAEEHAQLRADDTQGWYSEFKKVN